MMAAMCDSLGAPDPISVLLETRLSTPGHLRKSFGHLIYSGSPKKIIADRENPDQNF